MLKLYKFFAGLIVMVALSGCTTTYLTKDSLNVVEPGLSSAEVEKHLQLKPDFMSMVEVENETYVAHFFRMKTGERQEMSMFCNQYGCYPMFITVPEIYPFIFIYKSDHLLGWGLVEKLEKSGSGIKSQVTHLSYNNYKQHLLEKQRKEEQEEEAAENS